MRFGKPSIQQLVSIRYELQKIEQLILITKPGKVLRLQTRCVWKRCWGFPCIYCILATPNVWHMMNAHHVHVAKNTLRRAKNKQKSIAMKQRHNHFTLSSPCANPSHQNCGFHPTIHAFSCHAKSSPGNSKTSRHSRVGRRMVHLK